MIYIKYIVLISIFSISCFIGFLLSRRYKNRVNELRNFKEDLNILETKIRFTYKPLKDIFEEIAKNKNYISSIFEKTNYYLKYNDIKTSWNIALNDLKSNLSLNDEDINIVKGIGNFLRENRY